MIASTADSDILVDFDTHTYKELTAEYIAYGRNIYSLRPDITYGRDIKLTAEI